MLPNTAGVPDHVGFPTMACTVAYALLAVPMGQLVDDLSRKRILAAGGWSHAKQCNIITGRQ